MSDIDSCIESFRSALQSDDERENVKTPSVPNLPPPPGVTKEGGFGGGGNEAAVLGRRLRRRRRREVMVKRAELGFRVCEVLRSRDFNWLCIFRVSSMQSNLQFDNWESCYLSPPPLSLQFCHGSGKFFIISTYSLILAYLLISASSAAATRIDDWVSNWGEDKFTDMATLSVAMSLLAFAALALSTLISRYNLSTIA
ncbi:hypothetical protein RHGRI_024344 [Rhododendron griersonianum]|uniref:CASP-like protein n=1 Tax=Rhododendron griersonianum TaxID=479676 RepID=A0AAV6J712_9ERIC|nr:hypothetical protein RHGRI_024344 [Rhododendron griersonianum]